MTDDGSDRVVEPPDSAPEPLAFLVGSWNRFGVLSALATRPRTRDDLVELTETSRPTLSRILSDLTDRGWIVRRNDEYEATPKGAVVATEVEQFVENIKAIGRSVRRGSFGRDVGRGAAMSVIGN